LLTSALGFPPPDNDVRNWLLQSKTKIEALTRAGAFLCALFVVLLRYLKRINVELATIGLSADSGSLAAKFRLFMTTGQTFSYQGQPRRQFYDDVLRLADEVSSKFDPWYPFERSTATTGILNTSQHIRTAIENG
jgi:hypothetical protein